jgi:putative ABC transport system ATP-binding protein/lipoprotein-releasing system ATP-binding protein
LDVVFDRLKGTDLALVVATHDEDVAARMETRWTMDHGRLVTTPSRSEGT